MEILQILTYFIYTIDMVILLGSAGVFWRYKDVDVISKRPTITTILLWFGLMGIITSNFIDRLQGDFCVYNTFIRRTIPHPIFVYITMGLYISLKYRYNAAILDADKNSDRENTSDKIYIRLNRWNNIKFLTKYVYIPLHLVTLTLLACSIIVHTIRGDFIRDICDDIFSTLTSVFVGFLMIFSLVFFLFLMRKHHDAYYLIREFKYIFIAGIFGLVAYVFNFIPTTKNFGQFFMFLTWSSLVMISFAMPSIIALFQNKKKETSFEEKAISIIRCSYENLPWYKFGEYPQIIELFHDINGKELIDYHIKDIQIESVTRSLCFWMKVVSFHEIKSEEAELRLGQGYLMTYKFLKENGYQFLSYIDPILLQNKVEVITKLSLDIDNGISSKLDENFFDDILTHVMKHLITHLFDPLFESNSYQKYKSSTK